MAHSQWIRWEVGYRTAPKTLRLKSPIAVLGYPMLCAWAKGQGCLEDGIPVDDLDLEALAFVLGGCSDKDAAGALKDWIRVGYLRKDGDLYIIPSAKKWQPDKTAAERKRRQREREAAKRGVTNVTVTDRDNRASRGPDLTGRDRTCAQDARTRERSVSGFGPPPVRWDIDARGDPLIQAFWSAWVARSEFEGDLDRKTAGDISRAIADLDDPRDISPLLAGIEACFADQWCIENDVTDVLYILNHREELVRKARTPRKGKPKHEPEPGYEGGYHDKKGNWVPKSRAI